MRHKEQYQSTRVDTAKSHAASPEQEAAQLPTDVLKFLFLSEASRDLSESPLLQTMLTRQVTAENFFRIVKEEEMM